MTAPVDPILLAKLACVACSGALTPHEDHLTCTACRATYPVMDGVPVILPGLLSDWGRLQRDLYDTVAGHYDGAIPAHVNRHYRDKRVATVAALVPATAEVLDVGCGTGAFAGALATHLGVGMTGGGDRSSGRDPARGRDGVPAVVASGSTVVGIDASLGMLTEARRNHGVSAVLGRGEALPFRRASFDLAITIATLHHITDPDLIARTLAGMLRVVRPGGSVVIWDHNPNNPYWPYLMKRLPQDTGDERLIPLDEIRTALRNGGGEDIRWFRSGLVPEFTPPALLGVVQILEGIVERIPGLNVLCAHNVVVATVPREATR